MFKKELSIITLLSVHIYTFSIGSKKALIFTQDKLIDLNILN